MTSWTDLLDALDARTTRLAEALAAGERTVEVTDVELDVRAPLPPHLRLRVQVLLAQTQELEAELARLSGAGARAAAVYASH